MASKYNSIEREQIKTLANLAARARKDMKRFEGKIDGYSNLMFYTGEFAAYRLSARILASQRFN